MSSALEKSISQNNIQAVSLSARNDTGRLRKIRITKKLAETFRTLPTGGLIIIMPNQGKWKVRKYGAERASGIYSELETAIVAAKKIGRTLSDACIFVFDKNASIIQTIRE